MSYAERHVWYRSECWWCIEDDGEIAIITRAAAGREGTITVASGELRDILDGK